MKLISKKTKDLIPYTGNSKEHPAWQIEQIAEAIKKYGFNVPVLIDEKNIVLAGHGRLLAAKKLKIEEIPTICLSHLNRLEKKAFILADNKLNLNTGFSTEKLISEASEIIKEGQEELLKKAGFSDKEIIDMIEDIDIDNISELKSDYSEFLDNTQKRKEDQEEEKPKKYMCCPKCNHEWTI